jgi:hypothetical protein
MDMMEQGHKCLEVKRKEYKDLCKKCKSLDQASDELNATHERPMEAHEKFSKAHSKLEKAHSSLLEQGKNEVIVSCGVGLTCDILDESYKPIVVAPTNPSCSTTTSTSSTSDGFTCDVSLMVKNETLKKRVNELTRASGNVYGVEALLLKCLGSQRFSLNKERLGYTPKNGKADFVTHKISFVTGNGWFWNGCKQVGHIEQYCKNKNKQTNAYP